MSIRTTFNPLGTLGAELPLPQAVMTSNTTGRASDGRPLPVSLELYGGWIHTVNAYRAMDGNLETYQQIDDFPITESWWSMKIRMKFGKPVSLSHIRVDITPNKAANLGVMYMVDGTMHEYAPSVRLVGGAQQLVEFEPPAKIWADTYIIGWPASVAYAYIYEITYEGVYKS